ncbi:hypothetical protein [Natronomonas marina]|uniref:hypothetical protein n=1 Tax=Natronomonas marina TaxID=2961939 RepID=UPI0020CA0BD6|nr:hypothetical protein [Natronomonas marina]
MHLPDSKRFKIAAVVVLLVTAGIPTALVFHEQREECKGTAANVPAVENEFDVAETDERIRLTHEGETRLGISEEFDFKNVTVTISQEPVGQTFSAEWTTLEGGSYPIRVGDTATLRTARIPFDPAPGDLLSIDWHGYLGIPKYCDWVPVLPDRYVGQSNVHRQELNGTGPTAASSSARSAG